MAKKIKDGANKKLHSALIAKKKQKTMDEKAARKIRLKEIYNQVNAGKGDWRIIVLQFQNILSPHNKEKRLF